MQPKPRLSCTDDTRGALKYGVRDPVILFNVGALLDDVGRKLESIEACGRALRTDPATANGQVPIANCHRNSALLCEQLGRPRKVDRQVAQHRRLT